MNEHKLLIIISSGEMEKARAGVRYAVNALKKGWMDDVKLYFFGPSEALLLKDLGLQNLLKDYQAQERMAVACRHIAEESGTENEMEALGLQVEYVGSMISELIKQGYTPLVF